MHSSWRLTLHCFKKLIAWKKLTIWSFLFQAKRPRAISDDSECDSSPVKSAATGNGAAAPSEDMPAAPVVEERLNALQKFFPSKVITSIHKYIVFDLAE